jgi:hypothetical protein
MKVIQTQIIRNRSFVLLFLGLVLSVGFGSIFESTVRADTVTNCTQQDLVRALATDGTAFFEEDCDINITNSIVITNDMTIDGSGFTITISPSTTNNFSLFLVKDGVTLTLTGITLSGGHNTNGGGIYIEQGATATITDCIFQGNTAHGTNGFSGANGSNSTGTGGNGANGRSGSTALGGAIYNAGDLTLEMCQFLTNSATGGTGGDGGSGGTGGYQGGNGGNGGNGAAAFGGAIYDLGTVSVTDCTFDGNSVQGGDGGNGGAAGTGPFGGRQGIGGTGAAGSGAGLYTAGTDADIQSSTFMNNAGHGGSSAVGGTLSNGNGSNGTKGGNSFGGGVFIASATDNQVINCTFFNNTVSGGSGGNGGSGSYTAGNGGNGGDATGGCLYSNGQVGVTNCTFSNGGALGGTNGVAGSGAFAGSNGSRGASHGGDIARAAGPFFLANSIVVTNTGGGNGFGTITDGGYNISSDASITTFSPANYSKNKTNPLLANLADNGGPTPTMALLPGSIAINLISNEGAAFPPFDQRGQSRPQGAGADVGAYEAGPPLVELTNQIAALGADVTFTAVAAGDQPITLQWQRFGTNIPGAIGSTLLVSDASPANSGPYRVIASNNYGSSTSADAFINFAPFIVFQPINKTVVQGASATFSVTNTGDTPLVYRWYFRGTNGGATNLLVTSTNLSAAPTNSSTYTIANVQPANLGNYFVSISNKYSAVTSTVVSLAFGSLPVIISQPPSLTTNIGATVTFNINATGDPVPTYQWQFNGTNLGGATGASFTLSNVQTNNSGSYAAVVSNSVGSITSAPAILTVSSTPEPATIIVQPASQIVVAGSNATFAVVATGTAPLSYQWRFNGVNISGATLSSYTRVHAQTNHAGYYDVFVSNGYGSDESDPNVTLRVLTAPVSMGGVGFATNTFMFTFSVQTGFTYVVEYKNTLTNSTWTTLLTTNGAGSAITVRDALSNNSSRFYRIRAQ